MASNPENYQEIYHMSKKGDVIISGDGKPIEKTKSLQEFNPDEIYSISPENLWESKMTRSKSYIFKHFNPLPYDPLEDERIVMATQHAMQTMAEKLASLNMHHSNFEMINRMVETLLTNPQVKYDPLDSETVNDMTTQLKIKDTLMMSKDNEIKKLKAQIMEQETKQISHLTELKEYQKALQQRIDDNLLKQQEEFQEQMKRLETKRHKEVAQLEEQMEFMKTALLKKPDPGDNTPTPDTIDNVILREFTKQMKEQNQISKQNQLSLAPSYDGADPKQFNTWLDNVKRLAIQFAEPYGNVALYTSRGSLYRFLQEHKNLQTEWEDLVPKLREIYSDCTSAAAAQSKLASIKQNGKSMHGYIENFTELLNQAHNKEPADFGTDMLACLFIEGIDTANKHMRSRLRKFYGTTLDAYFKEALKLQKEQELKAIDYDLKQESETCDVNAIRSQTNNCHNCGSPKHFVRDCPDQNKQQQNPSHSNPKQFNSFKPNPQSQNQSQSHSYNRQTVSIEQAMENLTKALYSFKNNSYSQSQDRPRQSFQNNRQNTQPKQAFRSFDNKQKFKNNYHKQSTHVNEIESFEEHEPQQEENYGSDQEDLIALDPSETFEKN